MKHSYSMTVWERDVSVFVWGCSVANLLLFVRFLLFRQTLSSWAPFSSTRLSAFLALLNKPFTHLFIPFFFFFLLAGVGASSKMLLGPSNLTERGGRITRRKHVAPQRKQGKLYFHYERCLKDQALMFWASIPFILLLHAAACKYTEYVSAPIFTDVILVLICPICKSDTDYQNPQSDVSQLFAFFFPQQPKPLEPLKMQHLMLVKWLINEYWSNCASQEKQ